MSPGICVETEKPTSDIHASELKNSLGPIQALKLDDSAQIVQHLQNAVPKGYTGLASAKCVQLSDSDSRRGERTVVVDIVVIPIGELERTEHMGNDIFECRKVPRVEDRVGH